MRIDSFAVDRLPRVVFGAGSVARLPDLVAEFGRRVLIVTGARSLRESARWTELLAQLEDRGIEYRTMRVTGEPSPTLVDDAVHEFRPASIDVVLGIGGGSVLDAAKAIAGLLPTGSPAMDHLEGVGRGVPYHGPATPFIAAPTTAGTGSEATRNAVLSVRGPNGFKKSFRHATLVPQYAVIDPELLRTCPPAQIAANGMDALTQLIESYVSTKASPFTDALALSGLRAIREGFIDAVTDEDEEDAGRGRACMAYGSLLSGITLAQAGLGSVHGLAAPLGAFFPVPHGVACGTLLAAATDVNIEALLEREPDSPALDKYAELAEHLGAGVPADDEEAWDLLVDTLTALTERFAIPRLGEYGVAEADLDLVVANARGSSMQTNPITLSDEELFDVLATRL